MTSVVSDIEGNLTSIDRLLGDPANGSRIPSTAEVPSATADALEAIGKCRGIWFLVGLLERDSSGTVYNIQLVISADVIVGKYRNAHVPTTEIGTWRDGENLPIFSQPKIKFGIEICDDKTVFAAICNQMGYSKAGHTFSGVTLVCDPTGQLVAQVNDGANEEIVLADLEAVSLEEARHIPETFFRHFRRPEIYDAWRSN
jgi:predicted amidohydrolase